MYKSKTFKTIETWFNEELEEPYKTNALKYSEYFGTLDRKVESVYEGLKQAFVWQYTKENQDHPGYWNTLAQKLQLNNRKKDDE